MPRKRRTKRGALEQPQARKDSGVNLTPNDASSQTKERETVEEEEEEHHYYYEEEEENEMCLPWEVWVNVLDFLSCDDLSRFSRTCRLFHAIADMGMVWRGRAEHYCWREMERWGRHMPDGSRVGWRNLCKSYLRLRWASCAVRGVPALSYAQKRKCFETAKTFVCLAVDEESFERAPDVVALGLFGCLPSTDCVQLWREGEDKQWNVWRGIKGHKSTVSCIKFVDATDRLVTGSWDKTIKVWHNVSHDSKQASCAATLVGHTFEVQCIARHQSMLVSGSQDRTVALWDMAAGKCVRSFAGHSHFVSSVLFDKEGQTVMSASLDKTIRVWDPRAGADPVRVYHTSKGLTTLALNADGTRLYYGPSVVNQGSSFWVDMNAGKLFTPPHSHWYRLCQAAADAEHFAMLPFRLNDEYDHLLADSSLFTLPIQTTGPTSRWASVTDLTLGVERFNGSKGVCWTNSQTLVTGGNRSVFMADVATKSPAMFADRQADELGMAEARQWLQKVAAAHQQNRKVVSLPATQPSAEEVAMDVARIQRQIAQIQSSKKGASYRKF